MQKVLLDVTHRGSDAEAVIGLERKVVGETYGIVL